MKRVTILGGTGTFGGRIARALAATEGLAVAVAGRNRERGPASPRPAWRIRDRSVTFWVAVSC